MRRVFKTAVFAAVFYLLCYALSWACRDDTDTYTRALMRELHSPSKFDMIICGASHVSHGLYPAMMEDKLGISAMCTGTPNQNMDGTYALLCETLSRHKEVKAVAVECDFAVAATDTPWLKRKVEKSFALVFHYLKDPRIKMRYMISAVSPAYYLNCTLPIGKECLLDISPSRVCRTVSAKLDGSYWRDAPRITDGVYASRGCVIDETKVEGGLSSGIVQPINVKGIGETWKQSVSNIAALCKEKGIDVFFFSNPSTSYYLLEKGNYDEYISFLRQYIGALGLEYYDFSLIKEDVCEFEEGDFFDDNHLNRSGIEKFTSLFCDFIAMRHARPSAAGTAGDAPDVSDNEGAAWQNAFYASFAEKQAAQKPCVYGLVLDEDEGKKGIAIYPVMRQDGRADSFDVRYDVTAMNAAGKVRLETEAIHSPKEMPWIHSGVSVHYPPATNGKIIIDYYLDGEKQGTVTENYTAL